MVMKDKYYKYYKYYLDFVMNNGKSPTTTEFSNNFGFTRERGRQILNNMVKEGYMLKLDKGSAKYYPSINFIEKYV